MSHYDEQEEELEKKTKVHQPNHYQFFEGVEAIEVIAKSLTEQEFKGYCLGNKLKYSLRAGKKDKAHIDLAKANEYVRLYHKHKHLCR